MGDDWPDLPVLRRCAFASARRQRAHRKCGPAPITSRRRWRPGRLHGAAREFCDLLLVDYQLDKATTADRQAEVVYLRGGVRVVAEPPAPSASAPTPRGGPVHFAGEGLRIDTRQRIVASEQPVVLTQDHSRIEAQSIVYNDQTRVAELGGRVRGRYTTPTAPRGAQGQTGARP
jgi:hypothetical protein